LWLHLTGEVDKAVRSSCQIFSGFNIPKLLKAVNFYKVILKIKRRTFWGYFGKLRFTLKPYGNVILVTDTVLLLLLLNCIG